ncbi:MAG: ribonuclease J [Chloroflexi bacterium]|nr:ribonuclease J [Chloroflexota bacterium]
MMALEYGPDIVVIDAGLMFPNEELGVDLIIPDITYLLERRERVRGIAITHGHEDHIGALPYVLRQLNVPVYATKLTCGLIQVKLKEHKLTHVKLHVVNPGEPVTMGKLVVDFFRVNHSIPDAAGIAIKTPLGQVIFTGDFKMDHTPAQGLPTDLARLAQWGSQGVFLLLSDSTYVEQQGYTPSEQVVGAALERLVAEAPGRVIVATFASLISRVQQVMEAASKSGRKVAVVGRSMVDNVDMAQKLGFLRVPPGLLVPLTQVAKLPPQQALIIATGTQGEPTSTLVRIANGDHPQLRIHAGDTVILSASPIPGNETTVSATIDNLFKRGAQVYYSKIANVHVSGHGSQEEQKMMLTLARPKFFFPIHGEYRHLVLHSQLAQSLGFPKGNTFVLQNGDILELNAQGGRVVGRATAGPVYVDGLGVGDVGQVALRDRKLLAQDGIVVAIVTVDKSTGRIVGRPDIISRGFVDGEDSKALIAKSQALLIEALNHGRRLPREPGLVHAKVKSVLTQFFYDQTKRRPMIMPVAVEV